MKRFHLLGLLILGGIAVSHLDCSSTSSSSPSSPGGSSNDYPFWGTIGNPGNGSNGTFVSASGPSGVAVGNGALYVADRYYSTVDKFDLNGNYLGQHYYGSNTDWGGMAVDKLGNVYVANYVGGSVNEFDQNLNPVHTFYGHGFTTPSNFSGPFDVKVDSNLNLYVTDYTNNKVYEVSQADAILNTSSGIPGGLSVPYQTAMTPNGNFYVADTGNSRIVGLNSSLAYISSFNGSTGTAFSDVTGIASDSAGNLITTDGSTKSVQKFSPSGAFLAYIGNTSGTVTFTEPFFVAVDSNQNVYISDYATGQVDVFNP